MRDAGPTAEVDEPGLLTSSLTMLRLLIAWCCTALGVLGLLMGVGDAPYLTFHLVLLAGGLLLLGFGAMPRRPALPAYLTFAAVALLGLVIAAAPRADTCCLHGYADRHGYPFALLGRAASGHWRLDFWHTVADLVFWACAGLFALVLVAHLTPARRPDPCEPHQHRSHAETKAEIADDENVGGLP